jgi:hypothetical protein
LSFTTIGFWLALTVRFVIPNAARGSAVFLVGILGDDQGTNADKSVRHAIKRPTSRSAWSRLARTRLEGELPTQNHATTANSVQSGGGIVPAAQVEQGIGETTPIGKIEVVNEGVWNAAELMVEQVVDLCF